MPVHNEERYFDAALASLYHQTLTDWELIVVDDGSTDATPAMLEAAHARDSRVRIIKNARQGLVAALNAGLAACSAEIVARMDGDDICHPERFSLQYDYLAAHPDIDLVACGFRHFPRSGLKQGMLAYEHWQNSLQSQELIMRDIFVESPFVHPSIMIRRSALDGVGGYRECGWPEDYDLWLRLAGSGTRFARLPQVLFFWRDHPERSTRTLSAYSTDAFRRCKREHLLSGFLNNEKQVIIAGAGNEGRAWGRLLQDSGITVTCWIDVDPKKIGRLLHGAPVCPLTALKSAGSTKTIAAIGVRDGRRQFRAAAIDAGLEEFIDYVCVS